MKCYNCDTGSYSFYDQENGYTLVKCTRCGLLYVNPRPQENEINEATKTGVHKGDAELNVIGKYSPQKTKKYLEILSLVFPTKMLDSAKLSWLDIGSGYGEFIDALDLYFGKRLSVDGIEPNEIKRKHAIDRKLSIYPLVHLTENRKYNVISSLNVFSHLPNPIEAINEYKNLLHPHGEILLETGNTANLKPKDHPKPYFLPDHLSFASKDILVEILKKCGFEIINVSLFRSGVYPRLNFMNFLRETYLVLIMGSLKNRYRFYAKNPNIDMWIYARRID